MSADYTLPPVPSHKCTGNAMRCFDGNGCECAMAGNPPPTIEDYGHAVAAPLLARIAELEAQNTGLLDQHARDSKELRALCEQRDEYLVASRRLQADKRALLQGSQEQASEISRLRAEVEAKAGEVEALRDCLAECLDDLSAEINARALGELPRRIERDLAPVRRAAALLAQPAGSWVNPLAAEVEKLRNRCQQAHDAILSGEDDAEVLARLDFWSAARKGEGSE